MTASLLLGYVITMLPRSHLQVQDTWQVHLPSEVLQQYKLCEESVVMEFTLYRNASLIQKAKAATRSSRVTLRYSWD